jgi:L-fuconolactonase
VSIYKASNYLPVRSDWLVRSQEEALEPELPIIDAHHHLWDRPGWRYLFDDYLADVGNSGHSIVASVFIQCQAMYRAELSPNFGDDGGQAAAA